MASKTAHAKCNSFLLNCLMLCCAICSAPLSQAQTINRFDINAVHRECARLRCDEPNVVAARHFSDLVERSGAGCIVHVFPAVGQPNWHFWNQYVLPLMPTLSGSNVNAFLPAVSNSQAQVSISKQQENLRALLPFYQHYGARRIGAYTADYSNFLPPYRSEVCTNLPVLEIISGARLISPAAAAVSERAPEDQPDRSVLIFLESSNAK